MKPETILSWHRRLVAKKFEGSRNREYPGRPRIDKDVEDLVVRIAKENRDWGYDRISGAFGNLGHKVSDQTVGNILKRHGIAPAPERRKATVSTSTSSCGAFRGECQLLRRALGEIREGGVPLEAQPLRRGVIAQGFERLRRALSREAESSGRGPSATVPRRDSRSKRRTDSMRRAPRWAAEVLASRGRMSFLATRGEPSVRHQRFAARRSASPSWVTRARYRGLQTRPRSSRMDPLNG